MSEHVLQVPVIGTVADLSRGVQTNYTTGEIFDFSGNKIYPEFQAEPSVAAFDPAEMEPSAVTISEKLSHPEDSTHE